MPLDAPPPMPPPPTAGEPMAPPSNVDALGDLASGGTIAPDDRLENMRMIGEIVMKILQTSQAMGDQATAQAMGKVIADLTDAGQGLMQGLMAGPMASNGLGAPPPPGGPASMRPPMLSPVSQPPTPMQRPPGPGF